MPTESCLGLGTTCGLTLNSENDSAGAPAVPKILGAATSRALAVAGLFPGLSRLLGHPVVPFYPFVGEGSPTKIDYRKKVGTLILTSLLEE